MHSYSDAERVLGKRERRKLQNNTYLERLSSESIVVRLHNTHILVYHQSGDITYQTGGWRTITSKARMNEYGAHGVQIWSDRSVWYIGTSNWRSAYYEGFVVRADGSAAAIHNADTEKRKILQASLSKFIKGWVTDIRAHCADGGCYPLPGAGDCLYCQMRQRGEPRETAQNMGLDCVYSHMAEGYFVPSLLWRAIQERGRNVQFVWALMTRSPDIAAQDLRWYLKKHFERLLSLMPDDWSVKSVFSEREAQHEAT